MDLPTLNFAKWSNGDASQRLEFANSLADSFKKHGFVKIINHGVPDEHIRELFGWVHEFPFQYLQAVVDTSLIQSKRYFKMPIEAKEKSRMKLSPGPQRGWIPYGIEKTSGLARIHNQAPKIAEEQLTDQRVSC